MFTVASLFLDSWASKMALSSLDVRMPFREIALARGSSYLVGTAHYAAGQGVMAWILWKRGVSKSRAAAAMVYLTATSALATAALALAGSLLGPKTLRSGPLLALGVISVAVLVAYFPMLRIARLVPRLGRIAVLKDILGLRLRDHLVAAASRTIHLAAVSAFAYGALHVWGLELPPSVGLATQPVLLLAASIPLTPSGLGTVQAIQVLVFSPFLESDHAASAESRVLACAIAGHAIGALFQVMISVVCAELLRRRLTSRATPL